MAKSFRQCRQFAVREVGKTRGRHCDRLVSALYPQVTVILLTILFVGLVNGHVVSRWTLKRGLGKVIGIPGSLDDLPESETAIHRRGQAWWHGKTQLEILAPNTL